MVRDFSHGKIERIQVAGFPADDLPELDPDITEEGKQYLAGIEHIMLFLEHNNAEDWYWRYGSERLYPRLGGAGPDEEISWKELHEFVSSYAWLEGKWRFILNKPCWMLHMDVADRVVMLHQARHSYEATLSKSEARTHLDFLSLLDRLAEDVTGLLSHCEIKTATDDKTTYSYIHHSGGDSIHEWVPSLLHRIYEWDTLPLPEHPVMHATPIKDEPLLIEGLEDGD